MYDCPDEILSGLDNVASTKSCYTINTGNEDIYFATIFRGMIHNAMTTTPTTTTIHHNHTTISVLTTTKVIKPLKLPSVLEAAFFSTETQWLQDVIKHYNITSKDIDTMIDKLAWWDGKYSHHLQNEKEGTSISSHEELNHDMSSNVGVEDGRIRFQRLISIDDTSMGKKPFISIGMHKVWKHAGETLMGNKESMEHFLKECPYMKDIIPEDYYIKY